MVILIKMVLNTSVSLQAILTNSRRPLVMDAKGPSSSEGLEPRLRFLLKAAGFSAVGFGTF